MKRAIAHRQTGQEGALRLLWVLILTASIMSLLLPPLNQTQARAAGTDYAAIDAYITGQMAKHGLRGVSLAITQADEIAYLKGYGTAGQGRPMTAQTPMFLGSQSKSFTALAIAQLAEEGKVDVKASVRDYIPWFAVTDAAASEQITVAHLLHHTSGLSDAGFASMLPEDASIEDAVRALASARLTAPLGTQHQYFNMGYVVLALIIETVSGQSYANYIQEHILDPLQMAQTTTEPAVAKEDGLSQGYSRFFGFTVPARQPSPAYEVAAGYIISSAEDMAHYAIALNNDGLYEGTRVLSTAWMRQLFAPVGGYGMGWYVARDHIWHGGANETFKTFVDLYPGRDLGVVILINQGYMVDHFISAEQLAAGVHALAMGSAPAPVANGPSVRVLGWGLGILVLGLCVLHTWNIYRLFKDWRRRAATWSKPKLAWDVTISFLIPTVILVVVFSQVKGFWGDRFNMTYQLRVMARTLTDITVLMIVGSIPDYVQGIVKLYWTLRKKVQSAARAR